MNNTHPYDEMEVVQEFISCYKHYKALWDNSSVDYLSKKMKEPGYLELLKILRHVNPDANVNDVKRKINSLRCCYRRELKKIQSSFDGYETRLWWFHKMDFLKPVLNIESPRQGQHKQEEAEEEEPLDSYDDEDDDGGDNDEELRSTQEFFRLYRSMPELWLTKSECYRNRALKARSYQRLLDHMRTHEPSANIHTLKRKINNFRTSYRRELRKMRRCKANGTDEEQYVPTLWYFKELDFLYDMELMDDTDYLGGPDTENEVEQEQLSSISISPVLLPRPKRDHKMLELVDASDAIDLVQFTGDMEDDDIFAEPFSVEEDVLELDGDIEHVEESSPSVRVKSELKSENQTTIDYIQSPEPEAEPSTAETSRQSGKERRRRHSSADESVSDVLQQKKRRLNLHNAQKIDNECDIIGKRMAVHFRNMRMDQRLFAERIISEVLIFGRMNRLSLDARFLPNGSS